MRLYHGEHKTRSVTDAEPHNSSVPHNSSGGKGPRAGLLGALCVLLDLGLGPGLLGLWRCLSVPDSDTLSNSKL